MEYGIIVAASIIFFASLSLMAIAFSKKPTKKHIKEMEEAGLEIAKQIQEVTEESLKKIEDKMIQLENMYNTYEKTYQKNLAVQKEIKRNNEKRESDKVEVSNVKMPEINITDEKAKKVFEYYQKGMTIVQIAKEMDMYAGVVQVYINLLKMKKEKVSL